MMPMIIAQLTMAGLCFMVGAATLHDHYLKHKATWWTLIMVGDIFAVAALINLFLETV